MYDPAPRDWSADEVKLLEQLAASVVAELELAAARTAVGTSLARLDVAMEASSIGIWEVDLVRGVIDWDQRCAAIFGLEGARTIPMDRLFAEHVHPDDQASAQEAMQAAIDARAQYTVELRTLHARSGEWRWTVSRGRVLVDADGEPVRILGTVLDVTEARREAEARLAAFHRATAHRRGGRRVGQRGPLRAAPRDRAARCPGAGRAEQRAGDLRRRRRPAAAAHDQPARPTRSRSTSTTRSPGVEIELDDTQPTQYAAMHGRRVLLANREEALARSPPAGRASTSWASAQSPRCPCAWRGGFSARSSPLWATEHTFAADDVEVLEALAAQIALSVSRLQADTERATAVTAMTEANQRLQLLAEAGRILSGTLEIDQQVAELVELVVPELGDWCWLVVADDQGRLHEMASAHRDPRRNGGGRGVRARHGERRDRVPRARGRARAPDVRSSCPRSTGTTSSRRSPTSPPGRPWPGSAWDRRSSSRSWPGARPSAPSGCSTGAEREPLSPAQVDTAIEIGLRAGLALHHARLFGQQRDLADALQRSMLTEPPEPDHSQIVVRYGPAAAGREIGGDWYDAFLQPDGATVIAIGDVVGHDTRAAAAMGQVRGLLRGIGFSSGGVARRGAHRARPGDRGPGPGHDGDRRWSRGWSRTRTTCGAAGSGCAGPARVTPRRCVLDARRHGQLLDAEGRTAAGRGPRDRAERARDRRCSTRVDVLLYTDGLVERRDRDLDAGTAELLAVLRGCADLPLDRPVRRGARAAVPAGRRRTTSPSSPAAAPAGRAAAGRGRPQTVPPNIEPTPDVLPRGRLGRPELRARRQGRLRVRRRSRLRARRREIDGDRRLPAAPHRQHPQAGHQHDHDGCDRQRLEAQRSRRAR